MPPKGKKGKVGLRRATPMPEEILRRLDEYEARGRPGKKGARELTKSESAKKVEDLIVLSLVKKNEESNDARMSETLRKSEEAREKAIRKIREVREAKDAREAREARKVEESQPPIRAPRFRMANAVADYRKATEDEKAREAREAKDVENMRRVLDASKKNREARKVEEANMRRVLDAIRARDTQLKQDIEDIEDTRVEETIKIEKARKVEEARKVDHARQDSHSMKRVQSSRSMASGSGLSAAQRVQSSGVMAYEPQINFFDDTSKNIAHETVKRRNLKKPVIRKTRRSNKLNPFPYIF